MKKNFAPLALIALTAIFFISCSKDKTVTPSAVEETPRMISKWKSPGSTSEFKYDQKNRYTEFTNQAGTLAKFYYTNGMYTGELHDYTGYQYAEIRDGKLDAAGHVTEFFYDYHQLGGPTASAKYEMQYDAQGQMLRKTRTDASDVIVEEFYWTDGNLTMIKTFVDDNLYNRIEFTYYNQPNLTPLDLNTTYFGFFTDAVSGKRSKDLVKTKRYFNKQNVVYIDYLFTWATDAKGYATSFKQKHVINNVESEITLEYNKP